MTKLCIYCPHPEHISVRCAKCKCNNKLGFWKGLFNNLGNAIGESLFGGNR